MIWLHDLLAVGGAALGDLFWLPQVRGRRIQPCFPPSHGVPRVDDQRVVSASPHLIRSGLCWRDAPHPVVLLLSERQMNDHNGAILMLDALPRARGLIGDRGCDSGGVGKALRTRRIEPCVPPAQEPRGSGIPAAAGSTASATRSGTCPAAPRTGAASPPGS